MIGLILSYDLVKYLSQSSLNRAQLKMVDLPLPVLDVLQSATNAPQYSHGQLENHSARAYYTLVIKVFLLVNNLEISKTVIYSVKYMILIHQNYTGVWNRRPRPPFINLSENFYPGQL